MNSSEEVMHVFSLINKRLNEMVEEKIITKKERDYVKLVTTQNDDGSHRPVTIQGTASDDVNAEIQKVYRIYLENL